MSGIRVGDLCLNGKLKKEYSYKWFEGLDGLHKIVNQSFNVCSYINSAYFSINVVVKLLKPKGQPAYFLFCDSIFYPDLTEEQVKLIREFLKMKIASLH